MFSQVLARRWMRLIFPGYIGTAAARHSGGMHASQHISFAFNDLSFRLPVAQGNSAPAADMLPEFTFPGRCTAVSTHECPHVLSPADSGFPSAMATPFIDVTHFGHPTPLLPPGAYGILHGYVAVTSSRFSWRVTASLPV